jgi:UDP-N-acetylmuramyl pentapeptide synthase
VAGYRQAGGQNALHAPERPQLVQALQAQMSTGSRPLTLLFKGSRSARMETLIDALEEMA